MSHASLELIPYYGRFALVSNAHAVYAIGDDLAQPVNGFLHRGFALPAGHLISARAVGGLITRVAGSFGARSQAQVATWDVAGEPVCLSSRPVAGALSVAISEHHQYVLAKVALRTYALKAFCGSEQAERASVELPNAALHTGTLRDGVVVVLLAGDVIAFDETLRERWRLPANDEWEVRVALARRLIVVKDVVVRNLGAAKKGKGGAISAHSTVDGRELWQARFPGEVSVSEMAGRLYCATAGLTWVIDAASGEMIVAGLRAHEGSGQGDMVWADATHLWCASPQDQTLRRIDVLGQQPPRQWRLPGAFKFWPVETAHSVGGRTYLRIVADHEHFRGGLGGILCIEPGGELPEEIKVQPFPRHRVDRTREAGKDRYRVALYAESLEELRRFGAILAKNIAQVYGTAEASDDRSNPAFGGVVEVAVPLEALRDEERQNLEAGLKVVADQVADEFTTAADGSRIQLRLVSLQPGELDGTNASTTFESPGVDSGAGAVLAVASGDDVPDAITDALQGAKQDPAWRLGFAAVVLGGAALGDGFAERRERANEWLKKAYGEHADFAQEFIFNTGVLLTTPGVARRLWGSDDIEPKTVFEDFKRGVIQLAEWINARKLSVDEGLAVVKLLRALMEQLVASGTGAKGGKGKGGLLGKLSKGGAKSVPKQAKPVFDAIEAALSEVERQLRQQS